MEVGFQIGKIALSEIRDNNTAEKIKKGTKKAIHWIRCKCRYIF